MKCVLALLALLGVGELVLGQWGTSSCAAVAAPRMAVATYRWVAGQDPAQLHLVRDGRQVGTWRKDSRQYYPFDGERWGDPIPAPVVPPAAEDCDCTSQCPCKGDCKCRKTARPCGPACRCVAGEEGEDERPNYGIDEAWLRGRPLREAGESPPNDGMKLRLTVIGPRPLRDPVLNDLEKNPQLAQLRPRLLIQGYDPGHWAIRPGFVQSGQPTIYLQAPSGKVLHRQDDYKGGPEALYAAIRKADPNYDPRKDPDLRTTPVAPSPAPSTPWLIPALTALALWVYNRFFRREKA